MRKKLHQKSGFSAKVAAIRVIVDASIMQGTTARPYEIENKETEGWRSAIANLTLGGDLVSCQQD